MDHLILKMTKPLIYIINRENCSKTVVSYSDNIGKPLTIRKYVTLKVHLLIDDGITTTQIQP